LGNKKGDSPGGKNKTPLWESIGETMADGVPFQHVIIQIKKDERTGSYYFDELFFFLSSDLVAEMA